MTEKYARYRNKTIQRNFLEICPRGRAIKQNEIYSIPVYNKK